MYPDIRRKTVAHIRSRVFLGLKSPSPTVESDVSAKYVHFNNYYIESIKFKP